MHNIRYELLRGSEIERCRSLCNELMAFQKSKALIAPEKFDLMNFDTRMKKSYEQALNSHVLIAEDNGMPAGYIFSTIDIITAEAASAFPDWAPKTPTSQGFYPTWVDLPQKIGCLSNLYLRKEYQKEGIGGKLYQEATEWFRSFSDLELIFVFISNGNDEALEFYLRHGFVYSHDVFDGFIKAAYMRL